MGKPKQVFRATFYTEATELAAAEQSAEMKAYLNAVNETAAKKTLQDMIDNPLDYLYEFTKPDGTTGTYGIREDYIKYLNDDGETFARAYAQYIAKESEDALLLEQLDILVESDGGPLKEVVHWTDEDFEPVHKAMTDLFKSLGWME